jgi:hypothetical protein
LLPMLLLAEALRSSALRTTFLTIGQSISSHSRCRRRPELRSAPRKAASALDRP